MRRSLRVAAALVLALAALGCLTASAAGPPKPSLGDYQSAPVIPANRDYSVGVFSVRRDGGKRQIVPTTGYLGIYYPDADECDRFNLPLVTRAIQISRKGRFKHREKTPVGAGFVTVSWKGRWVKAGVVNGSIKIKYGSCKSKRKWTGGRVIAGG